MLFGNDHAGNSGFTVISNVITGGVFTFSGGDGYKADSITANLAQGGPNAYTHHIKCALYRYSDLSLIGVTEEKVITDLVASQVWVTFNFITPPMLVNNTEYLLCIWADVATEGQYNVLLYNDNQSPNAGRYQALTYGEWPGTLSPSATARQYSIYCTCSSGAQQVTCSTHYLDITTGKVVAQFDQTGRRISTQAASPATVIVLGGTAVVLAYYYLTKTRRRRR